MAGKMFRLLTVFMVAALGCKQFVDGACQEDADCGGQGTCDTGTNECTCDTGFVGEQCQHACTDAASCSGHGTCQNDGTCTCSGGYHGTDCSKEACADQAKCKNGGTCEKISGHDTCTCAPGYEGDTCETAVTSPSPDASTTTKSKAASETAGLIATLLLAIIAVSCM